MAVNSETVYMRLCMLSSFNFMEMPNPFETPLIRVIFNRSDRVIFNRSDKVYYVNYYPERKPRFFGQKLEIRISKYETMTEIKNVPMTKTLNFNGFVSIIFSFGI